MSGRFIRVCMWVLWGSFLLSGAGWAGDGYKPLERPAYTLYAIISGQNTLDRAVLEKLARNFALVQAKFDREEIDFMHKANPDFKVIHYVNGTYTQSVDEVRLAEAKCREDLAMYLAGSLASDVTASSRELRIVDANGKPAALKPSTLSGSFSSTQDGKPSTEYYVTWVRVDSELMRLDALDATAGTFTVTRGFAFTQPASHGKDARVFCPVYLGSQNDSGSYPGGEGRTLRYSFDVAGRKGWQRKAEQVLDYVKAGYDGAWLDITCAYFFNLCDMTGQKAQPWDFAHSRPYKMDDYREGQERKLNFMQEYIKQHTGRHPCLVANNFHLTNYEVGKGGSVRMMQPTEVKPRPLDGFCIESSFGAPKGGAKVGSEQQWNYSVQATARAAQDGVAALPMIGNAGGAAGKIEPDIPERDRFERYGYASYLLAVEKGGKTMFGIPACYKDGSGKRFVKLNEQYYYPIGDPVESRPWNDIKGYRIAGKNTYMRKFTGGLVLVNPTSSDDAAVDLGGSYLDPVSGSAVASVGMPSKTGRILLGM